MCDKASKQPFTGCYTSYAVRVPIHDSFFSAHISHQTNTWFLLSIDQILTCYQTIWTRKKAWIDAYRSKITTDIIHFVMIDSKLVTAFLKDYVSALLNNGASERKIIATKWGPQKSLPRCATELQRKSHYNHNAHKIVNFLVRGRNWLKLTKN